MVLLLYTFYIFYVFICIIYVYFIYLHKYGIYYIYYIYIIFSMSYSKGANQKNDPLCFEEERDSISGLASPLCYGKCFLSLCRSEAMAFLIITAEHKSSPPLEHHCF